MDTPYELPEQVASRQLGPSEHLLWSGRPRQGFMMRPSDALLIPFSLMWGGFAIFWEASVITSNAPFFFRLWGIPFVVVGLYLMVGRFVVDARARSRTAYAITDERVLIISGQLGASVRSLSLSNLPELTLEERPDRTATITFGPAPSQWQSGRWLGSSAASGFALEAIPEARAVYDRIPSAEQGPKGAGHA